MTAKNQQISGYGAEVVVTVNGGSIASEFVQTGGDDPPDWLVPPPRDLR